MLFMPFYWTFALALALTLSFALARLPLDPSC